MSPIRNKTQVILRSVASVGVSLLILGLLFGLFAAPGDETERPRLIQVLRHTNLSWMGVYLAMALIQTLLRARRYIVLILASGEPSAPGLFHTCLVSLTRNMLIDLLPARLGELSYVAMMNKGYRVSGKACVSSLAISFLFDFIALLFIMAAVAASQLVAAGIQGWLVSVLAVLTAGVAGMVVFLFLGLRPATALLRRLLGNASRTGIMGRMMAFLDDLAAAIDATRAAGVLMRVLTLSLGVRLAKYAGLYFAFHAVVDPSFPALSNIPATQVLFALLGGEAAASAPIPSFMSFGTYEAGGLLALTLLGFSAAASRIAMLGMHIWSQVVDYSLGGLGFTLFLLAGGSRNHGRPTFLTGGRQRLAIAIVGVAVFATASLGWFGLRLWESRKAGALKPPPKGAEMAPTRAEAAAQKAAVRPLKGFLVWSSNRFGNHDILMLTLPDLRISRLTTHPHVDSFPRISPDGARIVFARSQAEWVSQRQARPWDVYLLDLDSGQERLVAANGNAPTWSEDGASIDFQRNTDTLVRHYLETGDEKTVFQAGDGRAPAGVELQMPSYSDRQGGMAVTLRGGKRAASVFFADGRTLEVGGRDACQLAWDPQDAGLYYVGHGGRQRTAFYRFDLADGKSRLWLDLPGAFSHEYFPRMSNDGRFLVFGASTGGHEHDTADYEIFLWRIGTPAGEAVRMTFHTGNDCWPDIYLRGVTSL